MYIIANLENLEVRKNMKLGFTLAEVLITLGIIGVVAAMTIPTLMASSKKTAYVTGLKKAFSQTNQALLALTGAQDTPGDLKATGLFPDTGEVTNFGDEFVKQFKVVKNYGTSALELPHDVS